MKNLDSTRTNRGPKPWVVLKFGISKMKIPWFTDVYIYIYVYIYMCVWLPYIQLYIYNHICTYTYAYVPPHLLAHLLSTEVCTGHGPWGKVVSFRAAQSIPKLLLEATEVMAWSNCWMDHGMDCSEENGWKMAGKWLEKPEHLCCVFDDFLLCSCSHLFRDAVKSPFFTRRPGSSPRFEV